MYLIISDNFCRAIYYKTMSFSFCKKRDFKAQDLSVTIKISYLEMYTLNTFFRINKVYILTRH